LFFFKKIRRFILKEGSKLKLNLYFPPIPHFARSSDQPPKSEYGAQTDDSTLNLAYARYGKISRRVVHTK